MVKTGHFLELNCGASGIPQPEIHWMKNGQRLYQDVNKVPKHLVQQKMIQNRVSLQNGVTKAKLTVDCVTQSVEGVYQCVAENEYRTIVSLPFDVSVVEGQ